MTSGHLTCPQGNCVMLLSIQSVMLVLKQQPPDIMAVDVYGSTIYGDLRAVWGWGRPLTRLLQDRWTV